MTTTNGARESIYERFATQWGTTTTVTLDGEKFDGDAQSTPWVRLSVRQVGGGQQTLGPAGAREYRRTGDIHVQVFVPITGSIKAGDTYAQTAREIFEGVSFSGVFCNDGQIREIGSDGKFRMHLVTVAFSYWETK